MLNLQSVSALMLLILSNIDIILCPDPHQQQHHHNTKPIARTSAVRNNNFVDSTVLLTLSQGSVYVLDLNTETLVLSSANTTGSYDNHSTIAPQAQTSKLHTGIDPTNPAVLSYEQLRQELVVAEQSARDQGAL